jgi:hypothetical protein
MYYLNAFNDMVRKRQENQMMGGGGYQNSVNSDYAGPSGPDALGLGPAQDRSNWRDAIRDMPPLVSAGLSMVPGIGTVLGVARAVDYGLSQQEASQLAPSRDARERSQDQFRASEIADFNASMQNTPQQSFRTSEISADNGYGGFGGVTGGADTMGFGGEYAHGGMVDARHLKGRAPAPDDGYGALQGGEYVITKAAVEKYGKRLLDAINNGTFR